MTAARTRGGSPLWFCLVAAALLGACGPKSAPADPRARPARATTTTTATTAAEARAIAQALAARMGPPPGGWKVQRAPHGQGPDRIDLAGRFGSATVVGTAPDGSARIGCVTSAAQAEALLSGAATTGADVHSGKAVP